MSVDSTDCEPWTVPPDPRRQRARKDHVCSACSETIRRGDLYIYEFSVFDGNSDTVKRCLRCDAIYGHLVDRHRKIDDAHVDRELRCGHDYDEVFSEVPPEAVAALAFMTADEAQAAFGSKP